MPTPSKKLTLTQRKKLDISIAARMLFIRHGFSNVSMDQIAEQARVSKRTLYQHFENKEILFQSILSAHWHIVFKLQPSLWGESLTTIDSLKHFAKLFLDFLYKQDTIDLFRLLISESQRFPNLAAGLLEQGKAPFTYELIRFLKLKQKSGDLRIKNCERAAAFFIGMLKEYHFWPMMLGFTNQKHLSNKNQLINETVEVFIKTYQEK